MVGVVVGGRAVVAAVRFSFLVVGRRWDSSAEADDEEEAVIVESCGFWASLPSLSSSSSSSSRLNRRTGMPPIHPRSDRRWHHNTGVAFRAGRTRKERCDFIGWERVVSLAQRVGF
jgi:hypothetical protein